MHPWHHLKNNHTYSPCSAFAVYKVSIFSHGAVSEIERSKVFPFFKHGCHTTWLMTLRAIPIFAFTIEWHQHSEYVPLKLQWLIDYVEWHLQYPQDQPAMNSSTSIGFKWSKMDHLRLHHKLIELQWRFSQKNLKLHNYTSVNLWQTHLQCTPVHCSAVTGSSTCTIL